MKPCEFFDVVDFFAVLSLSFWLVWALQVMEEGRGRRGRDARSGRVVEEADDGVQR